MPAPLDVPGAQKRQDDNTSRECAPYGGTWERSIRVADLSLSLCCLLLATKNDNPLFQQCNGLQEKSCFLEGNQGMEESRGAVPSCLFTILAIAV
jgi:hypothetical protein